MADKKCIGFYGIDFHAKCQFQFLTFQITIMVSIRCAVSERWIHGDTAFLKQTLAGLMPSWMFWIVRRKIQKQAYDQGMGRHTREEALKIGMDNFQALSDYLGSFFF